MLPELTRLEFAAALDAASAEVLAELPIIEPPVDAIALARRLGLSLAWDDTQPGRGRIVRRHAAASRSLGSILLRHDPRRERLQWTVAHEIGETLAAGVFARLGVDPREAPSGAREMVANHLAGRILLPSNWFDSDARDLCWQLPALKQRYSTASHELIARRMLDCSPPIAITIFDNGRRSFRRGNLPGRLPPLAPLEQAAWRVAHETGQQAEYDEFHCRVQAWPIHEAEWKREILRTEWLTDADDAGPDY